MKIWAANWSYHHNLAHCIHPTPMVKNEAMGRHSRKHRPPINFADPSTWYSRNEVAILIKHTIDGVRYLQKNGTFHPQHIDGIWRFDPQEIDRYLKARAATLLSNDQNVIYKKGELASAAFAMFKRGCTRRDVVLRLKIEPDVAQRLWEQYQPETFEEAAAVKLRETQTENEQKEREARRKRVKELIDKFSAPKKRWG